MHSWRLYRVQCPSRAVTTATRQQTSSSYCWRLLADRRALVLAFYACIALTMRGCDGEGRDQNARLCVTGKTGNGIHHGDITPPFHPEPTSIYTFIINIA
jgi:hypothetical protein